MVVEAAVAGVRLGLERPWVLLAVPVLVSVVAALVLRPSAHADAGRRRRLSLFAARSVVLTAVVVAVAGPYAVHASPTGGEPEVTLLVDRSDSVAVTANETGELATAIEQRGVDVTTRSVGSASRSPVGDAVAANLEPGGTVVLASDGRVTDGRSLAQAAQLASRVNATISSVESPVERTERYVTVAGPRKASAGVENTFLVGTDGVDVEGSETRLVVDVDGEQVLEREVTGEAAVEVNHTFAETGSHRITARIEGADRFDRNDVARKTVRVVPPPKILYVSRGSYPLESYLSNLYDVERARSVPDDPSGYYAVVVQNVAAGDLGNGAALRRAVVNGTGLVTVGGPNAYENGGYESAPIGDVVPVQFTDGGRRSTIVVAVDVSGSTKAGLSVQKALALDVLSQLGDGNRVGVVAFNAKAHAIAEPRPIAGSRGTLRNRIRRLQSKGQTDLRAGLLGSEEMLDEAGGTVVLISDGRDEDSGAVSTARRLASDGTRVVTVGVGQGMNADYLRRVADAGDGSFLRADETNRLRIRSGGPNRQFDGGRLTAIDRTHFITEGVRFTADPASAHAVSVRKRAEYLVATGSGQPAISAWRYGLGRSVAITAYGSDGSLGGLLSTPDSLAVTKSVNWAIGDPQRLATGVADVPDARVGDRTAVTYRGDRRPSANGTQFARVGPSRYRATFVPREQGYESVLGATYAVNYPREYRGFGTAPALEAAVRATGGRTFDGDDAAAIADYASRQATDERTTRRDFAWVALATALCVFLVEVGARRIARIRTRRTAT